MRSGSTSARGMARRLTGRRAANHGRGCGGERDGVGRGWTWRRGGSNTTNNSRSITIAPGAIVINQQPGQDARALADAVMERIESLVDSRLA
jgi:hypothetical protein